MQTRRRRNGRGAIGESGSVLHIAVVVAADGVLFTAVEESDQAIRARMGEFARANAPTKLWPRDAKAVLRHLDQGEIDRAVQLYFERVGGRWDPEILHRQVVAKPGVEP